MNQVDKNMHMELFNNIRRENNIIIGTREIDGKDYLIYTYVEPKDEQKKKYNYVLDCIIDVITKYYNGKTLLHNIYVLQCSILMNI